MTRNVQIILILATLATTLAACGGTAHQKKSSDSSPAPSTGSSAPGTSDPGYSDPGYSDPGSLDPGSYDTGSIDGGSVDLGFVDDSGGGGSDPSEETASRAALASVAGAELEAVNYDASAYVLYVNVGDPRAKWRRLYLPPVPAAPPGGAAQSSQTFHLRPGSPYSLVLEAPDGRTLDVQSLGAISSPSRRSFSIVGATLVASLS
jgi:hypothetical protein